MNKRSYLREAGSLLQKIILVVLAESILMLLVGVC